MSTLKGFFSTPFIDDSYKIPDLKPGLFRDDQQSTEVKSRTGGSLGEYEQAKAKEEPPQLQFKQQQGKQMRRLILTTIFVRKDLLMDMSPSLKYNFGIKKLVCVTFKHILMSLCR